MLGARTRAQLENYFFERLDLGRPVCVPGTGSQLAGLLHVRDLATAMAAVVGPGEGAAEARRGQVFNFKPRRPVSPFPAFPPSFLLPCPPFLLPF